MWLTTGQQCFSLCNTHTLRCIHNICTLQYIFVQAVHYNNVYILCISTDSEHTSTHASTAKDSLSPPVAKPVQPGWQQSQQQSLRQSSVPYSKNALTHTFKKLRGPSRCRECDTYVYFHGHECEIVRLKLYYSYLCSFDAGEEEGEGGFMSDIYFPHFANPPNLMAPMPSACAMTMHVHAHPCTWCKTQLWVGCFPYCIHAWPCIFMCTYMVKDAMLCLLSMYMQGVYSEHVICGVLQCGLACHKKCLENLAIRCGNKVRG